MLFFGKETIHERRWSKEAISPSHTQAKKQELALRKKCDYFYEFWSSRKLSTSRSDRHWPSPPTSAYHFISHPLQQQRVNCASNGHVLVCHYIISLANQRNVRGCKLACIGLFIIAHIQCLLARIFRMDSPLTKCEHKFSLRSYKKGHGSMFLITFWNIPAEKSVANITHLSQYKIAIKAEKKWLLKVLFYITV